LGAALVTGAAGGVGSMAISLFADKGWRVIASTGRQAEAAYLKALGADEVIDRATLSAAGRPLGNEQWAAAVDSVGSTTLANVLAQTRYGGAVASCGLAGGMDLATTVAPFILRGVSLLGIDSVHCPTERRLEAWRRLALDLDRLKLASMTQTIPLAEVFDAGARILKGETRGRLVVTIP
jgi:acrylyl-CoA reductase (NADPH)